jgi:PadR family transcriptional regulator PadR
MRVDKELSKGSHELLLLKLLSRGDKYGYQLIQEMALLSDHAFEMSQGSLYPFLHRLETRGLLSTYREEAGGRSRVLYHLTEKGQKALAEKEAKWRDYVEAVESILRGQAECRTG